MSIDTHKYNSQKRDMISLKPLNIKKKKDQKYEEKLMKVQ